MHRLSAKTYQLKPKLIGIDASRAFLKKRTGIEEYSYQVIQHLREVVAPEAKVILYVRKKLEIGNWKLEIRTPEIDFPLPENWTVRGIWAPRFWTQIRLAIELLLHPVDTLFVPAHTVPWIHPKRTVVTVHGLEYEFSPESYSWYERLYMRFSIRNSVRWASQVIAVSENTKRDLVRLYSVPEEKITVIYEGANNNFQFPVSNFQSNSNNQFSKVEGSDSTFSIPHSPFFLFIGRVEERKNVGRIIEAFEIFRQKTGLPHKLILAGKPGYGYENISYKLQATSYKQDIIELGYISEEEKWELLRKAEALVFPSLYEGFGLPVIEAQMVGTPVITSTTSSLPEIASTGALLVDPFNVEALALAMEKLATDPELRAGIIDKATRNADRFSWAQCARGVAQLLSPPKNSSPA